MSKVHNDLSAPLLFDDVAIVPTPADNAAVARQTLPKGTAIALRDGSTLIISHTVLEGHRFSLSAFEGPGGILLSWGLPFGITTKPVARGEYLVNDIMLKALKGRSVTFELPTEANFYDPDTSAQKVYEFDESKFVAKTPIPIKNPTATFKGFYRGKRRGAGTRNHVAVIALTSLAAPFVRSLETRYRVRKFQNTAPNFDGVRIVAHTEGESPAQLNLPLLLRTLAGFSVHCNLGACVMVSTGNETHVTAEILKAYLQENNYPVEEAEIRWVTLAGDRTADLGTLDATVEECVAIASKVVRTDVPCSNIRIALQCGGSDSFSGLSGNPLAGEIAARLMELGSSANLAESPELVGAESYILENVSSLAVARQFLDTTEAYKRYACRHGQDAAGNPSGGNLYRGLYNIVLKSLGAARKKRPTTTLSQVIQYGQPMSGEGQYVFMDSPGNDLESIAGQVGSGCNIVLFVTGNGAMTNFPFVPTLKIVTTTGRFKLLENEMDINAGRIIDGVPLDVAGQEAADLTLRVANGEVTKGEIAGHSQVSIWRNWYRPEGYEGNTNPIYSTDLLQGQPISVRAEPTEFGNASTPLPIFKQKHIGIVLPTSICSSEIARTITEAYNEENFQGLQWVSPQHTEGCGAAGGPVWESLFNRLMVGHVAHPFVQEGLFLEHGCEKTHNDYFRIALQQQNVPQEHYGFVSIQHGGGLENSRVAVRKYFESLHRPPTEISAPLSLGLAVHHKTTLSLEAVLCLGSLTRWIVQSGGTVVIPSNSPLLGSNKFLADVALEGPDVGGKFNPTLAYAQSAQVKGLHIMEIHDGMDWVETISGLSVPSTCCIIVGRKNIHGSLLVPTVNIEANPASGDWGRWYNDLVSALQSMAENPRDQKFYNNPNFTIPRGTTAVSL